MAQKQIIWSAHAKKMLYAVLESLIREKNSTRSVLEFFKTFSGNIRSLLKEPGKYLKTSDPDVVAIFPDKYMVLFECTDSENIILWIGHVD